MGNHRARSRRRPLASGLIGSEAHLTSRWKMRAMAAQDDSPRTGGSMLTLCNIPSLDTLEDAGPLASVKWSHRLFRITSETRLPFHILVPLSQCPFPFLDSVVGTRTLLSIPDLLRLTPQV